MTHWPEDEIIDGYLFFAWGDDGGGFIAPRPDPPPMPPFPSAERARDLYLRELIDVEEFERRIGWLLRLELMPDV